MKCAQDKVQPWYLSNIKALKGLLVVSRGGGILWTIAFKISKIPTPSYKERQDQIRTPNSPLTKPKQRIPKFAFAPHHAEKDGNIDLYLKNKPLLSSGLRYYNLNQ